jgi:hypothetical protein
MNTPRLGKGKKVKGAIFFKKTTSLLAFSFFLFASSAPPARAAFEDSGWGARPIGMGEAFSAVADDSNAPLYNPAGLVQVQWNEVSASYADLFSGQTLYSGNTGGNDTVHIDQGYLSFVGKPLAHFGSYGFSWASFQTTGLYREDTVMLSYARNVGDFIPALDNMLAFGINAKYLHRGISLDALTVNDPVFAGGDTAQGGTVDVGFLFKPQDGPFEGLRIALVGQDLTQPNVGFQEVDQVPAEYRLGFAYQSKMHPWLVPALDLTRRDDVYEADAGIESWLFHDTLGLRVGVGRDAASAGISYYQTISKRLGFRFDYGFQMPFYVQGTAGNQRLALTAYF